MIPGRPQTCDTIIVMYALQIDIPIKRIEDFCRRHHIHKLALFGSVLGEDFDMDSDIDVLVEFEKGHIPGFKFFQMQEELGELLGRSVDLNTPNFLSPYFRDDVRRNALIIYEQPRSRASKTYA